MHFLKVVSYVKYNTVEMLFQKFLCDDSVLNITKTLRAP